MNIPAQNPSANLPAVLNFEGAELKIIDRDGLPWITSGDLGRALGYKRGGEHVASIYRQHAHEFCEAMTTTIPLRDLASDFNADSPGRGNPNVPVRIFSPRGAHLIGMFSRTAKAAAFRRWVLDVLDGYASVPVPGATSFMNTRVLVAFGANGQVISQPVAADAFVLRAEQLPELVADPAFLNAADLVPLALAALRRIEAAGGTHAVRNLLAQLDDNYLLVLESELILSLYGSPAIWNAAKQRGRA